MEILVIVALFATLTFSLFLNVRGSSQRIKSEGLARALAEELRAARSLALEQQTSVLVAFPATSGGGVCRSFRVYQGEDGLHPVRTLGFDHEYDSYIFAGTWPAVSEWQTDSTLEASRLAGLGDVNAVLFRADGSMLTNLPRLDGAVLLAVDNSLEFTSGEGLTGQLVATSNPNTVAIAPSGVIRLEKGLRGLSGSLARTEQAPSLLALLPVPVESSSGPSIRQVTFSPKGAAAAGATGLGKTYIEIHPVSGDTRAKEYGLASITAEATDPGGGPLTMQVTVSASVGEPGTLASDGPVRMEYLDDRWIGTVGWRPPANADPDVVYDFDVAITNARGQTVSATSDASVLPTLHTLNDFRLAVEASDHTIHLANLEGGELVRVTPADTWEELPVWSGDGTKLFVLAKDASSYVFVSYNADGTNREVVSRFPPDASGFEVDPAGMYLKYVHDMATSSYRVQGDTGPKNVDVLTCTLSALHVSNGAHQVTIASGVDSGGVWIPNERGLFQYSVVDIGTEEGPKFGDDGLPIDGETDTYDTVGSAVMYNKLSGLGPSVETYTTLHPFDAAEASFNPSDPNYFTIRLPGGDGAPSKVTIYRFKPADKSWDANVDLATNLSLIEPASWSANGKWLAYLVKTGEISTELRVQKVTIPPEGAPEDAKATFTAPRSVSFPQGVSQPRPTPDGENVLYIDRRDGGVGAKLMRLPTSGTGGATQIGKELPGVESFAITQ